MFNVYYINYAKAFEIAMQMDNKILEQTIKDKGWDISADVHGEAGEADVKKSFLSLLLPKLSGSISFDGSKSSKTSDTIKVVSTKSTVLAPIVKKSTEIKKLDENKVGNLIKIKNVQLTVHNGNDMLAAKALLSGVLDQIPIDGIGSKDLTGLVEAVFKGASYILTGNVPEKVKTESVGDQIILKIPMQLDNEMESQYSIADIEIGPVTIIGIYRGKYNAGQVRLRMDTLSSFKEKEPLPEMETADESSTASARVFNSNTEMHYIDIIAIIQELYA